MTVAPASAMRFRTSMRLCAEYESNPLVGSSSITRLGRVTSSTPHWTRFFSPPLSPPDISGPPPMRVSAT